MGHRPGDLDRRRPLHLLTSATRYLRELAEFLAIPSVSGDRRPRATMRARGRVARGAARASPAAASSRPDGHPVVLGEWLGAPGAPTILVYGHYDVQPPGRRGRVGDAAVRAERARRPHLRPRRDRRQGAGAGRRSKVAEAFHAQQRRLPLNVRFLFEGEEEIGSPSLAGLSARATATSSRPTSWSRPTARCGGRPSRRSRSRRRGCSRSTSSSPARAPTCTRAATAAPSRIRTTRSPRSSPACTHADGAVAVAGLLRRRRAARRARPRRRSSASRSTRRPTAGEVGVPGAARRARLHDARAALDAADARGERDPGGGSFTVIPRRARAHITCRLVPGPAPGGGPRGDRPPRRGARARRASR